MERTWVITGATSIIAEQFAHTVAAEGYPLRLIGRNSHPLDLIAKDIQLRYNVLCETMTMDLTHPSEQLTRILSPNGTELDLFIAHSDFTENAHLNEQSITHLIQTNILTTTLLIHAYLNSPQKEHHLMYLSSVAACRGRAKNSLYGASKSAVEVYLEGLQQAAEIHQHISIAKLGFIDTKQTYGLPGIFYAAPPKECAQACWNALQKKKRRFYYPRFWQGIMAIITRLPFVIFKRMKES